MRKETAKGESEGLGLFRCPQLCHWQVAPALEDREGPSPPPPDTPVGCVFSSPPWVGQLSSPAQEFRR